MMLPLDALLDYAFAEDRAKLRPLLTFLDQLTRALRVPDPEDEAQNVCLKLFATPALTRSFLARVADRSPELAAALDDLPTGSVPKLSADLSARLCRVLQAYVERALRNAAVDAYRQRRTEPLPEEDALAGTALLEEPSDVAAVRARVLAAVKDDALRPAWLDETIEVVEALATADVTMEALTQDCVKNDASLAALPPDQARIRARNRLQQQHRRAREYLAGTVRGLTDSGALDPEDAQIAERWLHFLLRRQNPPTRPSRRSTP